MMKNIFFTALCAVLFAGCATPDCTVSKGELSPGVPEYTFNNGMIEIKVVSGVSGIVNRFCYLPEDRSLFEPMEYSVKTHDLIPPEVKVSVTGGRELIWGIGNFVNVPMDVKKVECTPEKASIAMTTRYFQGENIEAEKAVIIEKGTLTVTIDFTIQNRQKKEKSMSLWKHLTAQLTPDKRDIILIPAKGGVKRIGSRAVLEMAEDVIYHDYDPTHQSFYIAPLATWIGRCSSDGVNRGTLVMSAEEMLEPGAFFYSWKHTYSPLHTAEMVLPPRDLAPKEVKKYSVRYYYFPHLAAVRAIDGDIGFNAVNGGIQLESVRNTAPGVLTVSCIDGKKTTVLGKFDIPALKPGKLFTVALDKNIDTDNTVFVLDWNGRKITLPKVKK